MKTKIATAVGILLVVLGTGIGIATKSVGIDIAGAATVLLGAGAAILGVWKNRDPSKPKWISIVSISAVAVGAVIAGLSGFHDEKIFGDILGAVISVVTTILGIIFNAPKKQITK